MRRLVPVLWVLVVGLVWGATPAAAQTTVEISADWPNRGWFRHTGTRQPTTVNYAAGQADGAGEFRNFFIFDLSSLAPGDQVVTSARLKVRRFNQSHALTYALFHVATDPNTVKNSTSSTAIFADLGSGTTFGSYAVGLGASTDILTFDLNAAARTDIAAAAGRKWAVGGAVQSIPGGPDDYFIFGRSSDTTTLHTLEITLGPPVPEPGAPALFVPALAVVALLRRRRA